jgi:hypothetical protein
MLLIGGAFAILFFFQNGAITLVPSMTKTMQLSYKGFLGYFILVLL